MIKGLELNGPSCSACLIQHLVDEAIDRAQSASLITGISESRCIYISLGDFNLDFLEGGGVQLLLSAEFTARPALQC
jgi:hypothetical protein